MNFRSTPGRRRGDDFAIDLMPLVDVVFLLLIFFLITTSFSRAKESQIPINLPTGVTGAQAGEGDRAVLFVTDTGEVEFEVEGVEVEGDDLQARLRSLHEQRPEIDILLKGDTAASHGRVVEILDTIKATGFSRVNLVIRKEE